MTEGCASAAAIPNVGEAVTCENRGVEVRNAFKKFRRYGDVGVADRLSPRRMRSPRTLA